MNELLIVITLLLVYISIQLSLSATNQGNKVQIIEKKETPKHVSKESCVTHVTHLNKVNNYPCRQMITPRIPINISTRGECGNYSQIGVLTSNDNTKILPLFGRQIWRGASKWHYSTQTDKLVSVFLPVYKSGRNCSAEYGCDEIYDNDEVEVPQLNEVFKVSIYNIDAPRYIPYI